MRCVRISIPKIVAILIFFVINHVKYTQLTDNHMIFNAKNEIQKNSSFDINRILTKNPVKDRLYNCPENIECNKLGSECIECTELNNLNCIYGTLINTTCRVKAKLKCKGNRNEFQRSLICRYCYQTEPWENKCDLKEHCASTTTPRFRYRTNCTVNDDILCLGHRTFNKFAECNWTGGYQWSTALILSITLGGFGADRFYLGHWQEGIGKLFSFGGLGVWTIIDVILISLHYLGPADGSLYI